MKEYSYTIDRKISTWVRDHVIVKANTQDEADLKCVQNDFKVVDREYLEPGKYNPTLEILDKDSSKILCDNNFDK